MDESTPLQGLTFLNTRDARSAGSLTDMLTERGAQVVECPTIEFIAPASWQAFDTRVAQATHDDWVVFTSANAVTATMERLWELNRPPATLSRGRIAAIGLGTANLLRSYKLEVDLMPGVAQQEMLLETLLAALKRSDKVWIPRAQDAREVLVDGLRAEGYQVLVTPVYRTVMPKAGLRPALDALGAGRIDWIVFSSPSTVNHFFQLLDEEARTRLAHRWPQVACIGAVTAEAARDQGLPVAVLPARQDLEGMVAAIADYVTGASSSGQRQN